METFIFKFGQDEFICQAPNRGAACLKASSFVDNKRSMTEPFAWIASSEGPNIFRMTVGA